MLEVIFWSCFLCICHVYIGYPLILMVWSRVAARPVRKASIEPSVSVIITMHDEAEHVDRRIQNCLRLDYSRSKLQIIVSLDAPTAHLEGLARSYEGLGVRVVTHARRSGKAACMNRGVREAHGEIVLFGDARQTFEPNVVHELVANFADETVGAVSGALVILDSFGHESNDTSGVYWRYEKKLRAMESAIHSATGATGAIYAIRRKLFTPLPPDTVLDDVMVPMRVVLAGKRVVFDPRARAYDTSADNPRQEFQRKTRTLAGNYQLMIRAPDLLLPWRNPIFLQYMSHKVGRLVVPHCMIVLLVSNLFLAGPFYRTTLFAQIAFYLLALIGWLAARRRTAHPAGAARTVPAQSAAAWIDTEQVVSRRSHV